MGVRNREEISQALNLNVTNHQRKQMVMSKIQETKGKNPDDKNLKKQNDPLAKKNKPEEEATMDVQGNYPMLKPVTFTNPM